MLQIGPVVPEAETRQNEKVDIVITATHQATETKLPRRRLD